MRQDYLASKENWTLQTSRNLYLPNFSVCKGLPKNSNKAFCSLLTTPKKLQNHEIKRSNDIKGNKKLDIVISRNNLNHILNENDFTCLQNEFFLPTFQFLPNFVHNKLKNLFFFYLPTRHGSPR